MTQSSTADISKEELRQKLRAKIRGKRSATTIPTTSEQLKADPAGALLRMGIDDPTVLAQASELVNNPHTMLNKLKSQLSQTTCNDSDDEEAPP